MEPSEAITQRLPSPLRVVQAAVMASTRVIFRKNTADAITDWGGAVELGSDYKSIIHYPPPVKFAEWLDSICLNLNQ